MGDETKPNIKKIEMTEQVAMAVRILFEKLAREAQISFEQVSLATITIANGGITIKQKETIHE